MSINQKDIRQIDRLSPLRGLLTMCLNIVEMKCSMTCLLCF